MPQEPVDHSPNWVGLRLDIHAHFEDDEEILRDLWELGNFQLEPFPDNEFVNREIWQAWRDDDSSISEHSDHVLDLLLDHEVSSEDGIPDLSDAEMDDNPVNAPIVLRPSALNNSSAASNDDLPLEPSVSDSSDSPRSPDSSPDFSDREIRYRERSGTETETEIDTDITTEVDEDPSNGALSPISSGELVYSSSHSEASSNDDLPDAFEPDIEIDFEAISDPLEPPNIKLEHVGSLQVVQNPPDEDHDHLLIVETPESPDSEHNDHDQGGHIVPLIPLDDQEENENHEAAWILIPPELDHNVIPPLGNQDDNEVIFLDAVDPEVREIDDEDHLARIQVALGVEDPLVHGPNDDVNDITILAEFIVLRDIEVITLDESDDDGEQEGMEIDDVQIIQIDGLFDLFSDISINRVDG